MPSHPSRITPKATVVLVIGLGGSLLLAAPRFSEWSPPVHLDAPINSEFNDFGPALSKDDLSLYFASDRPGGMGGADIWVSQRASREDTWGEPVNLGPPVNTALHGERSVVLARRTLDVLQQRPPRRLGSARHLSTQAADGSWEPAVLVPELSSPLNDQRPSVRFDGLELFLFSNRPGSSGPNDIWVSTRPTTLDVWSAPVNVGAPVNGPATDFQAFISSDRATLFFASGRPGGLGNFDLYVTTRDKNPKK